MELNIDTASSVPEAPANCLADPKAGCLAGWMEQWQRAPSNALRYIHYLSPLLNCFNCCTRQYPPVYIIMPCQAVQTAPAEAEGHGL